MSHLLRRRRLIHPPGSLRSRAVLWLDPRYHKDGREYLEDISGSGAVHDAVLGSTSGSDANDPDFFPWTGMNYLKFPSTAGNNAKITLAVATTYDYTITYDGGSTDTGTQVSDGSGVLTFAGDDAKFTNLNVRRIAVEPDGGGALLADLNFALSFSTEQVSSAAITLARTVSAAKLVEVTRPGFLLHTDDYLEIANHADLNFAANESFSVAVFFRAYGNDADFDRIVGHRGLGGGASPAGWYVSWDATGKIRFAVTDATNAAHVFSSSSMRDGTLKVAVGRRTAGVELSVFDNGQGGTAASDTTTGSLDSSMVLRIGANAAAAPGSYSDAEFYGLALFREALSDADILRLQQEFGV